MGAVLDQRRLKSAERISDLQARLTDAARLATGKACIYATGSFARGEASDYSDLDLFIVGKTRTVKGQTVRALKRLDETCIKADLIRQTRLLDIPEFSGDGAYLTHYTVAELVKGLGMPSDDADNTFTARLLLLLESRPLIGEEVYREAINETIDAYWRDFADHRRDFIPAFLANDILRLWRTFCVNYEARTKSEPDRERAKRKLKNYKLKHSRLLTCYSALLFLLVTWNRANTVTPTDAAEMVSLTPTQRLDRLARDLKRTDARAVVALLLKRYERFLTEMDAPEETLLEQIGNPRFAPKKFADAYAFGSKMFDALQLVGHQSRFHRMLVV